MAQVPLVKGRTLIVDVEESNLVTLLLVTSFLWLSAVLMGFAGKELLNR
jgi:hypothetical protein